MELSDEGARLWEDHNEQICNEKDFAGRSCLLSCVCWVLADRLWLGEQSSKVEIDKLID